MKKKMIRIKVDNLQSFSLDINARALYIGLSAESVAKTIEQNPSLFYDLDKKGNVVGIEVIRINKARGVIKQIIKKTESLVPSKHRKEIISSLQPLVS